MNLFSIAQNLVSSLVPSNDPEELNKKKEQITTDVVDFLRYGIDLVPGVPEPIEALLKSDAFLKPLVEQLMSFAQAAVWRELIATEESPEVSTEGSSEKAE